MVKLKKIIIIAGVLLLVSSIGYFLTQKRQESVAPSVRTPLPQSQLPISELNLPTGEKMSVSGTEIKNVYKTALDINDTGDVVYAEANSYQQVYHPKDQYFLISVTGSPFESARTEAEKQFLAILQISKEDACKLNVTITTPRYANPDEAGKIYKLSFCE